MSVTSRKIKTSHAGISLSETSGSGLPVLMLHGNSAASEAFRMQLAGEPGEAFRLVAVDLPGHGASADAFDPERTYTMPGYADTMVEVLSELGIDRAAVFGWSLGGHVAMELLPRFPGMVGLMICGAPPVGRTPEEIQAGFLPNPNAALAGKPDFTDDEVEIFARATLGDHAADAALRNAIVRTDGRARAVMLASFFTGQASDQRALVEKTDVPVAVVNGAGDPVVNLRYLESIAWGNLWDKHCYVLRDAAHAPFLEVPETFNEIFVRFANDMEARAKRGSRGSGAAKVVAA